MSPLRSLVSGAWKSPAVIAGLAPLLAGLPLLAPNSHADETSTQWSAFRGSTGRAYSDATTVPTRFQEKDLNWKVELPGKGHSSPVIWDDLVFLTAVEGDSTRHVLAYSIADGSERWRWSDGFAAHNKHNFNEFASSTPCLDRQHLYLFWSSGNEIEALALNHDGKVSWRSAMGSFHGDHGSASSPILVDGVLFLFWDDLDKLNTTYAGLNPLDGSVIWRKTMPWPDRPLKTSYSTPAVRTSSKGQTEVIVSSMPFGVQSFDSRSGELLWNYDSKVNTRTVATPILEDGIVFVSWGSGNGAKDHVALIPGTETKQGKPKVAWRWTRPDGSPDNKGIPYVPTSVAHDGLLYMWADSGLLQVIQARTGKTVYGPERVGGRFFSNPLLIGDHLYCASRDQNEMVVVKAGPKFKIVSRNPLGAGVNATPAVAHGTLFIRTDTHLLSVGGTR